MSHDMCTCIIREHSQAICIDVTQSSSSSTWAAQSSQRARPVLCQVHFDMHGRAIRCNCTNFLDPACSSGCVSQQLISSWTRSCGAMSHKTKDCMDRPRSKGAKWTGKHIAADEKVEDINLSSFDAKRDLWNGYNPDSYTRVVDMCVHKPLLCI